MMLSLDTAYRSFDGEVEASSTPTICRLPDSRRHQLSAIALLPAGWIVAIRLGDRNKAILDYLLMPTTNVIGTKIIFSEKARARHGIDRFERFDALARSLIRRVTKKRRCAPTTSLR